MNYARMLSPLGGYGKPAKATEKPANLGLKEPLHAQQTHQHPAERAQPIQAPHYSNPPSPIFLIERPPPATLKA